MIDWTPVINFLSSPAFAVIERLSIVIGAFGVVSYFAYKIYAKFVGVPAWMDRFAAMYLERRKHDNKIESRLTATESALTEILKQFKTNSGSTIKDDLIELRNGQKDVQSSLNAMRAEGLADFMLTPEPLWKADERGMVIAVNRAFCDLVGRDSAEFIGVGWKNVVHQDDLPLLSQSWRDAVNDGRDFHFHWRVIARDGDLVEVEGFGECFKSAAGEVLGWKGRLTPYLHDTKKKKNHESPVPRRKPKILVVDDSTDITAVLQIGLTQEGSYDVICANSGEDAIQQVEASIRLGHPPDVILLDYAMKGINGVETLEKIRETEGSGKRAKVYFFTGSDERDIAVSPSLGVAGVWTKPLDQAQIKKRLREALA